MEKYLFLDPAEVISACMYPGGDIFLEAPKLTLDNVVRIVDETNCKLVLISNPSNYLQNPGNKGNWVVSLNNKLKNMGYPSQFQLYSATPSLWAADIHWVCPVASWNKRYENSILGIQVALWLGINAEPDDKYAIITRDKKKEFFNNQKNVLFACETTGLTNQMADDIIVLLNSSET